MTEDTKSISVRIPDALHALLAASAQTDRRSINSQILVLIEEALAARSAK
jgi:hypothetical protein